MITMRIFYPVFVCLIATCVDAGEIRLSLDGPVSTPLAALEKARESERPVTIVVEDGLYRVGDTLRFGKADSGITWKAAEGASPVFSAGRTISGWEKNEGGLWQASVPDVKDGKWYFDQLWIGERRATRARTPNKGFYHIPDKCGPDVFPDTKNVDYEAFVLQPEHFKILSNIPEPQRDDVLITVAHSWSVGQCRIAAIHPPTRSVRIKGRSRYAFLAKGPDQRFWMENFRSALDEPGEWYLDRGKGVLYYSPLPGETIEGFEAVAPVIERFAEIRDASDIRFTGIRFLHSQYLYPENGLHDGQAAAQIGGVFEIENSTGIHFENCEIGHIGQYAIYFKHGNSHSSVKHCHMHDLGAGGVRIGTPDRVPEEQASHHIVVDDCIMQHGGRLHPSACGVVLTHAYDCSVTHCDIGDFYYSGVSYGWNWGYRETVNRRNRLENCHIHHIGWAYLSDMGGFYNLGNSPETVIRGNHVHHVACYDYGGWGLYNDEGSGDVLMEDNLVHDTSSASFHQHYGYANRIRNNIFAFGGEGMIRRSRNEPRLTITVEKNIVVWNKPSALLYGGLDRWKFYENRDKGDPRDNVVFRNNLYFQTDGKQPEVISSETEEGKSISWKAWRSMGRDGNSKFSDPKFVNLEKRDFRLAKDSPAFELGFKEWDLNEAGVRGGGEWKKLAEKGHKYPNWNEDAKPWPVPPFRFPLQTFEAVGNGALGIPFARWDAQGKGESIGVVDGVGSPIDVKGQAQSKKSLRVLDSPDLDPTYHPILHLSPRWEDGAFRASFDIMAEEGAGWFFEMRGNGEFAAGPYIRWSSGKLTANNGKPIPLIDLPVGKWCRVEVSAETGSGVWSVTVTTEDGTKKEFPDLPCKTEWADAGYLLWSSIGSSQASFYIDNLRLSGE